MSNIDDNQKNELLNKIKRIELSDTISQFMEKCNDNFFVISDKGGGPAGVEGEKGSQGVPTKPKVPIHVWKKEIEYFSETLISETKKELVYELEYAQYELFNYKYQEGHLILLENGHVYKLEVDENNDLKPVFAFVINTYNAEDIIDGKTAHVHFEWADEEDLIKAGINISDNSKVKNKEYIGIYSNNSKDSENLNYTDFTWSKIKDNDELIPIEKIDQNTLKGSDFANKLFSKQVTSSANFNIDSLNTTPEYIGNKVIVGGNNIKVLFDYYQEPSATLITSGEIDFDNFNSEIEEYEYKDKTAEHFWDTLYTNVKFEKNTENSDYTNDILESSYTEIGFAYELKNIEIIASILPNSKFVINGDEGVILVIEQYNETNKIWETINNLVITDWEQINDDVFNGKNSSIFNRFDDYQNQNYFYSKYDFNINDFNINESQTPTTSPKSFRFKLIIPKNAINIQKQEEDINNNNTYNILLVSKLNYVLYRERNTNESPNTSEPSESCVIIGRNGIFVRTHGENDFIYTENSNSEDSDSDSDSEENVQIIKQYTNNTFHISDNEIFMNVGGNNGCGLRITKDGIYIKNKDSKWQPLNNFVKTQFEYGETPIIPK